MYKEVAVEDLRVGMYVVDTNLNWMHHPFLYCEEGRIRTHSDLRAIQGEGYQSAFIDTEKSSEHLPHLGEDGFEKVLLARGEEQGENVPFEQEVETAREIYRDSVRFAKEFMKEAETGRRVDTEQAGVLVEDMIDSLGRNGDALVSLGKLKSYDEYTFTHSINVAVIALAFAGHLGLSRKELQQVGFAALFHDIGKSRVSSSVLNKPGRLSEKEFEEIKMHPVLSYEILKQNKHLDHEVLLGVVQHHEKYDGTGYPHRLPGHRISRMGVIVGLADVYDAVTSKRVYKPAIRPNQALKIMYGMRETAFERVSLERFIKFLGIYPVGTLVRLNNGVHGVVCESAGERAHRPKVKIAYDSCMRPRSPRVVDLAAQPGPPQNRLKIVKCLDPGKYNVDPAEVLAENPLMRAGVA